MNKILSFSPFFLPIGMFAVVGTVTTLFLICFLHVKPFSPDFLSERNPSSDSAG